MDIPVASSTAMPIQGGLCLSLQDQALFLEQLDPGIVNSGTLLFQEPHGNSAVSHGLIVILVNVHVTIPKSRSAIVIEIPSFSLWVFWDLFVCRTMFYTQKVCFIMAFEGLD